MVFTEVIIRKIACEVNNNRLVLTLLHSMACKGFAKISSSTSEQLQLRSSILEFLHSSHKLLSLQDIPKSNNNNIKIEYFISIIFRTLRYQITHLSKSLNGLSHYRPPFLKIHIIQLWVLFTI